MSKSGGKPKKPTSKKGSSSSKNRSSKNTASKKKTTKNKPPQDKVRATNTSQGGFGIGLGEIFMAGSRGFFKPRNALILIAAAIPVFVVFWVSSIPWQNFDARLTEQVNAQRAEQIGSSLEASLTAFEQLRWIALAFVATFPAGVVSAPWFRYALDAADGKEINIMAPLIDAKKWANHAFATFWFWAGITVGIRYSVLIPALPSIVVLVLYAFYGYVIADGREINALKALGISVRLGKGKRLGLLAIGGLYFVFNIFGLTGAGVGLEDGSPSVIGIVLGILGISATASITLVSGGAIYRTLEGKLDG